MALIINGEEISELVLEDEFDAIKEQMEARGEVVCCDRDEEIREYAHTNVLNRTLLRQEALNRFGENSDADIAEAIEALKEQHGGEEQFYVNIGMSPKQEDEIRHKVSVQLSVDRILREHIGEPTDPTEVDLRTFYEANLEEFQTEEEVRAWHIYLEHHSSDHGGPDQVYDLLRQTRREIVNGADFEAKVAELCTQEDYEKDLGFFKKSGSGPEERHMPPDIVTITFSMEVGEISPVISTHFGFHIFKLMDRKEPKAIPFEDIEGELKELYLTDQREQKINALLEELKSKATIEVSESEHEMA